MVELLAANAGVRTLILMRSNALDVFLASENVHPTLFKGLRHTCNRKGSKGECESNSSALTGTIDDKTATSAVTFMKDFDSWRRRTTRDFAKHANKLQAPPVIMLRYEDITRHHEMWAEDIVPFLGFMSAEAGNLSTSIVKRTGSATHRERILNFDDFATRLSREGLGDFLVDEMHRDNATARKETQLLNFGV